MLNYQPSKPRNILLAATILLLLMTSVFFGYRYFVVMDQLAEVRAQLQEQNLNNQILDFTALFIKSVLQSEGEVDFETRLQLESAVRSIGDEEILATWNHFVNAGDNDVAQAEVKNLLSLLVKKVRE